MNLRQRAAPWPPAKAAESLARLAYVERALAHILAGWAVKMPSFEAKRAFGLQMHRAMERSSLLRSRVNGLCHATRSEARVPAGWRALMEHIDRAQSPERLLAAVYRWLHPRLAGLYREHARSTDPVGDRASIEIAESVRTPIGEDLRAGRSLGPESRRADRSAWLGELDRLWEKRLDGEPLALDEALWRPVDRVPAAVRPDGWRVSEPGSLGLLPADPVGDPAGVAMFLHKELDEEYTTLELVARNSYEHPDMPSAFHRDMARQASDEARHAILIERLMAARRVRHGDFPLSTSSYDGLYEFEPCPAGSRAELLWRILIRQTFEEGLAIDSLALEIERRRAAGQDDIADAFDYILRDEVFHAGSGLRWSRALAGPDPDSALKERQRAVDHLASRAEAARAHYVLANLDQAMAELAAVAEGKERRGGKPPDRPLNRTGRAQAGYGEEDIAQVVAWGYAGEGERESEGARADPGAADL